MSQDFAAQVIHQAVITILMMSLPIVGVGLLVGFMVSLFQAVTQIQEQTLTFVPKVVTVLLMFAFTSPYIISLIVGFTTTLWNMIPNMAR